jgi:hypothetical protein
MDLEIMPCGPSETPKFKAQREEAKYVDEIENLQNNADFLSRREFSNMFRNAAQPGATPVKKTPVKQQTSSAPPVKQQTSPAAETSTNLSH